MLAFCQFAYSLDAPCTLDNKHAKIYNMDSQQLKDTTMKKMIGKGKQVVTPTQENAAVLVAGGLFIFVLQLLVEAVWTWQ